MVLHNNDENLLRNKPLISNGSNHLRNASDLLRNGSYLLRNESSVMIETYLDKHF